jgi:[amino group carrier protein]-lysine/ornithine hydrolase
MTAETTTTIPMEVAEALLHDLVAIPSATRNEAGAVAHLVGWMSDHGYTQAFCDEVGNAVGIVGTGDGSRDIILLGHIDTFPGMPPVRIEGRTLYGRGSVDAKGPLCTFAVAAAQVAPNLPGDVRLIVIGAVEEESSTSVGAKHVVTQYNPQACLIGEPSDWDRITLGYKGRLLVRWQWEGAFAHSAGEVPTAGERAYTYWEQVQAYVSSINGDMTSIFGRLDASIREIKTDTSRGGTHQRGELVLGFRLPPTITPEAVFISLTPQDDATIRITGREDTFVAEKDTSLTRVMRGAIRAEGGKPRFVYKTGTADMNVVGPRWNCPIVAYGPGDSKLDHTPNEHIDLDDYGRAVRVLTHALNRLVREL